MKNQNKNKFKCYDLFFRAALTGHGHPSPFWKTHAWNSKQNSCQIESASKWFYPKQVCKKADKSDWNGLFQKRIIAFEKFFLF